MNLLQRIFPLRSKALELERNDSIKFIPGGDGRCDRLLICSADKCSNSNLCTSLLFQAAVSYATEGYQVLYITKEPLKKLPRAVHGMPLPEASIMSQVKIQYMKSTTDLIDLLCSIHQSLVFPDVLIIDDLNNYFCHNQAEHQVAKLCALIEDTHSFLSEKRTDGETVHLLVSATELTDTLSSLCQRFFNPLCELRRQSVSGNFDLFTVKVPNSPPSRYVKRALHASQPKGGSPPTGFNRQISSLSIMT